MNIEDIKSLLKAFDKSKATTLEIEIDNTKIYMDKKVEIKQISEVKEEVIQTPTPKQTTNIHQEIIAPTQQKEEGEFITSPMVGTFYKAPSPNSAPYVKIGDKVKKGQVLCIIEAMKIMNEIEAEFDCEILDVLVEDGEPVEFDTPLFKVKRI